MVPSLNCILLNVYLLVALSNVAAFSPLPIANTASMVPSSIRLHFGTPFDTEVIETATTTIVAAVSADSKSGSAVSNFFLGSAVFVGAVTAFKWNGAEYSDNIREKWEEMIAKPAPLEESFVPGSTTPLATETPTSESGMPEVKNASSPQELTEMMKGVSDSIGSSKKKKRFVVKLLQKVVMPWRKWSNL